MNTIEFFKAHEHISAAGFLKEAQYLRDNWAWMKYSYAFAIKVRRRMQELGWTQKQLAESLGCSQQHVSILLKGRVNMTLETLAKLEDALRMDLISGVCYFDSYEQAPAYLNDSAGETGEEHTAHLVKGYRPRKKKGPKGGKEKTPAE